MEKVRSEREEGEGRTKGKVEGREGEEGGKR